MAYNSAYTGAQIDEAVGAVRSKEAAWDGKAEKTTVISLLLPASGWTDGAQTAAVAGVLADETKQLIQPMPAADSQAAYVEAGILCTGQAADSLRFTAATVPTADLTVYVAMTEVAG